MLRKQLLVKCSLAIGAVALLWVAHPAWGKNPRPGAADIEARVLVTNSSQPMAQFVPQAMLEKDLGKDVLPEGQYNYLRRRIDALKDPTVAARLYASGVAPLCGKTYENSGSGAEGPHRQTEADNEELLADLTKREFLVTGQVVEIVPGWNPLRGWVARAVYVQVEEVLKGREHSLRLDGAGRLPVLVSGGRVNVRGVTLCDEAPPFGYHPKIGDRVLVSGYGCPTGDCFEWREMVQMEGDDLWFHGSERTDDQPLKLKKLIDKLGVE